MNYETYKLLYNQLMALRDEQSAIANNKDTSRDDMNEAYAQCTAYYNAIRVLQNEMQKHIFNEYTITSDKDLRNT